MVLRLASSRFSRWVRARSTKHAGTRMGPVLPSNPLVWPVFLAYLCCSTRLTSMFLRVEPARVMGTHHGVGTFQLAQGRRSTARATASIPLSCTAQTARGCSTVCAQRGRDISKSCQSSDRGVVASCLAFLPASTQAFAATKRAVKASQAKVVPQATGPHHGQGTAHVPAAASLTLGPLPTQHAPTSPDLPVTAPATTQGPDGTHYLTVTGKKAVRSAVAQQR